MAPIKAVIVDFDDTLCMTEAACFAMENEMLRRMHRPPQSRKVHKQTWGIPLAPAMELRSPGIDLTEFWEVFPEVHAEYVKAGRIDAIPESNIAALQELRTMELQVMILTSRTKTECEHLLHADHLVASLVDAFYHKDNTDWHKPDPRVFTHIEKDHGLKPKECVYVGDALGDAAAAKGAGLHFVASLQGGILTEQDFADFAVDAFMTKFEELPTIVRRLASVLSGVA